MIPFLFVALGLLLILIEFYLPGAIMGILGGICVLVGIILFASQSSSLLAIMAFVAVAVVSIALLIRFAIWRIKHAKPQHSIYSAASQTGFQASFYDKNAIGKQGVVVADLKPGGYILIEGEQHAAISVSGYITKGEYVRVIGGQEQSLIVQLYKKE